MKLGTGGGGGTIVGHFGGVYNGTGMVHVGQNGGRHMSGSFNVFVGMILVWVEQHQLLTELVLITPLLELIVLEQQQR